jgi:hypothetical protein
MRSGSSGLQHVDWYIVVVCRLLVIIIHRLPWFK